MSLDNSEEEILPYDSLYEDNLLNDCPPVMPNESIYGQNNLMEYFDTSDYSVPIKYTPERDSLADTCYKPSETILNIDDNEYTAPSKKIDCPESKFSFEGYNSFDNYAPFSY